MKARFPVIELLDQMRREKELRAQAWSDSARNMAFTPIQRSRLFGILDGIDLTGFEDGTVMRDIAELAAENEQVAKHASNEVGFRSKAQGRVEDLAWELAEFVSPRNVESGKVCVVSFEQRSGCEPVTLTVDCGDEAILFANVLEARVAGINSMASISNDPSAHKPAAVRAFLRAAQGVSGGKVELFRDFMALRYGVELSGDIDLRHVWRTMRADLPTEPVEGKALLTVKDF